MNKAPVLSLRRQTQTRHRPLPPSTATAVTSARRLAERMLFGMVPAQIRSIRAATGLSRTAFAKRFGLSPRTVEQWESGRRRPDRAAVALLKVIGTAPQAVDRALHAIPSAFELMRDTRQAEPDDAAADDQPQRAQPVGSF